MNIEDIRDIGGRWYTYRLSPDGTEFTLTTEKGEAVFRGIEAIALEPTSLQQQQAEESNELDEVIEYRIKDSFVDGTPYWGMRQGPRSCTIAVGPPSLRAVINSSDRKALMKRRAFHLFGCFPYSLAVTIICREFHFIAHDLPERPAAAEL